MTDALIDILIFHQWPPNRPFVPFINSKPDKRGKVPMVAIPIMIRPGLDEQILLFDPQEGAIHNFAFNGKALGSLDCQAYLDDLTFDFNQGPEGIIFLTGNARHRKLVCVDPKGPLIWEKEIDPEEMRSPNGLLYREKIAYLTSWAEPGKLLRIDPANGATGEASYISHPGRKPLLMYDGRILNVAWFRNEDKRGFSLYDPEKDREEAIYLEDEWAAHLPGLVGVDEYDQIYLYTGPGTALNPSLLRISLNAHELSGFTFRQLCTSARGETGGFWNADEDGIFLHDLEMPGQPVYHDRVTAQENLLLANISGDGQFFFFDHINDDKRADKHWAVEFEGNIPNRSLNLPEPHRITVQQHYPTWMVTHAGRVMIPVVTPEGVCVLAVNL